MRVKDHAIAPMATKSSDQAA